jgi:hypothetical protein
MKVLVECLVVLENVDREIESVVLAWNAHLETHREMGFVHLPNSCEREQRCAGVSHLPVYRTGSMGKAKDDADPLISEAPATT